jgi:hypothetical protein
MRCRVSRLFAAVLAIAVTAAAATAASPEVAKARTSSGNSMITHAGQTAKVGDSTQFAEGDIIRVPADSRLTVEYGDGSSLAIVGPAAMRFGEITPKGRRLVLASGTISEATIYGIAVEIQAPNPYDASMVLQNARGFARVSPGDRITFEKLEGNFAKVWRDNKYTELGANSWTLNARDGSVTSGPPGAGTARSGRPVGTGKEQQLPNDTVRVIVGEREVVFHPASSFGREVTNGGGLKRSFQGAADAWGVVEVGLETTLFLAPGQSVEFAGSGDIIRFDGISHEYGRLFAPIMWDEPIENAIDASPEYGRSR